MATVRREFPRFKSHRTEAEVFKAWYRQAIIDLAAGRHAKDCKCLKMEPFMAVDYIGGKATNYQTVTLPINACSHISRCARDLIGYDVEVGDASV